MSSEVTLHEIADRLAIHDLLHRYAEMVDGREWGLFEQVFTQDARLDYTSTGGVEGDARMVMAWLDRALEPWPINLHCVSNIQIRFEEPGAHCRSAFHAPMARGELGAQQVITNAGYYEDVMVRTEAGWRIRERTCRQILMQGALPEGYEIPD